MTHRISARLDERTTQALSRYCARHNCSASAAIRSAIGASLAPGEEGDQAAQIIEGVCDALGLPLNASGEDMIATLEKFLATLGAAEAGVPADPTSAGSGAVALSRRGRELPAEVAARSPAEQKVFSELRDQRAAYRERLKRMRDRERSRGMKARK